MKKFKQFVIALGLAYVTSSLSVVAVASDLPDLNGRVRHQSI